MTVKEENTCKKEKCPKPESALQVRGPCTTNKFGGEGRPGSPYLGRDAAATPQRRGGLTSQPHPSPPSRDARDAWGGRRNTGRSRSCCGKWRVREAGTPQAAVLSRFPAVQTRLRPSPRPGEEKTSLWRCGRKPLMAALAGPVGKAVEVSASLLGGARGRRASRLPLGAGLGSCSRALVAAAAASASF